VKAYRVWLKRKLAYTIFWILERFVVCSEVNKIPKIWREKYSSNEREISPETLVYCKHAGAELLYQLRHVKHTYAPLFIHDERNRYHFETLQAYNTAELTHKPYHICTVNTTSLYLQLADHWAWSWCHYSLAPHIAFMINLVDTTAPFAAIFRTARLLYSLHKIIKEQSKQLCMFLQ
jgi:hypothetical protein